jgi:uncharacterized protein (DUF58 family)
MTFTKLLTVYSAAATILLLSWVLNVPQLYWMAGVLFLLPTGSKQFARLERRGLTVERILPPAAHQGDEVTVRLVARNETALPKLYLSLRDQAPRWVELEDTRPLPIHLAPRGTAEVEYSARLKRRGVHQFASVLVYSTDLLGLWDQRVPQPVAGEILVYPRVVRLPARLLVPELGGGSAPLETTQRKGEGSSFFGIREYRQGDPLRHVHWRTTARRGSLAVTEWEAEESRNAVLAVETAVGTDRPFGAGTTLDVAAGLAASMAKEILASNNSVRVLAPGAGEWRGEAVRGMEAMSGILETLARMQGTAEVSVASELQRLSPHLEPGSVVCWLTAVPNDALLTTARYLQAVRLRPVIYALIDAASGRSSAWNDVARELEAAGVPVVRVYRDDELVDDLLG